MKLLVRDWPADVDSVGGACVAMHPYTHDPIAAIFEDGTIAGCDRVAALASAASVCPWRMSVSAKGLDVGAVRALQQAGFSLNEDGTAWNSSDKRALRGGKTVDPKDDTCVTGLTGGAVGEASLYMDVDDDAGHPITDAVLSVHRRSDGERLSVLEARVDVEDGRILSLFGGDDSSATKEVIRVLHASGMIVPEK